MNTRCNQGILAILLLGSMGFGTTYAQSPTFSSFEYNQASNTVHLEWLNSTNAFYEMQASTNLMTGLWGQEGGWTNILGTNPTNSVILPADDHPNVFFRLVARKNSAGGGWFQGIALRANTNLLFAGGDYRANHYDQVALWDDDTDTYTVSTYSIAHGWSRSISVSNNQTFFYLPNGDIPAEFWSYAYLKDWRLTSPGALPVTGDVHIEWAALESYSTPSNPVPDIPFVDVTVMNSDYVIVTNWHLDAPVESSVIWESDANPDGYYQIEVNVGYILETAYKEVYLYSQ